MSDIGYRIKVYSDIRNNVGLRSLQSDIGSSDIQLSPISLITDIGLSAHLCLQYIHARTHIYIYNFLAVNLVSRDPNSDTYVLYSTLRNQIAAGGVVGQFENHKMVSFATCLSGRSSAEHVRTVWFYWFPPITHPPPPMSSMLRNGEPSYSG